MFLGFGMVGGPEWEGSVDRSSLDLGLGSVAGLEPSARFSLDLLTASAMFSLDLLFMPATFSLDLPTPAPAPAKPGEPWARSIDFPRGLAAGAGLSPA